MKDEIFDVAFTHQGKDYQLRVKTELPLGPEPLGADYDIYQGRKLWYILNHCKNEDEIHCWEIKKAPREGADYELAEAIGNAIDRHFG